VPGILAASLILFCNDPVRGINDSSSKEGMTNVKESTLQDTLSILSNWHWLAAVGGLTANTFALGAFSQWYSSFLVRYDDVSLGMSGMVIGIGAIIGGIGGTFLGSKVSQYFNGRCKSANFLVPAVFTLPGAACVAVAVNAVGMKSIAFAFLIIGQIFFFTANAPITTVVVSVVPVHLRSRSSGLEVFLQHLLGDAISPTIVGAISDATGSLQAALQVCWATIAFAGLIWFFGYFLLAPLADSQQTDSEEKDLETDSQATKPEGC